MKKLVLTDDLITGIAEIDNQHKEIFNWGNALIFPKNEVLETSVFMEGLMFLNRYVNYHFLAEEQAMMEHDYEQLENHKLQHDVFRRQVRSLYDNVEPEVVSRGLLAELHYLLFDWFTYHIKVRDRDFAAAVSSQGSALSDISLPTMEILKKKQIHPDELAQIDDITVTYSKYTGGDI